MKDKIRYHPSFGYATPKEVEKLFSLGMGPTRDALLKQIEKRNKRKGSHGKR
jgi:hypothetical protein